MNKYFNLIAICVFTLSSCGNSPQNLDYSSQRKHKFVQVIDILKDNNIDSIKKYVVNSLPSDTINYISSIEAAQRILTTSNGREIIDSIIQMDSVSYGGNSMYTYRLNFYNNSNDLVGSVEMSFLSDDTQRVGNLDAIENIKDTVTLRW